MAEEKDINNNQNETQEFSGSKIVSTLRTSQALTPSEFDFGGTKLSGLSQKISLAKFNKPSQTLSLLNSTEKSNVLLAITRGGENVTVFTQEKVQGTPTTKLWLSKEYVEGIKKANPNLQISDSFKNEDGSFSLNMKNVKFSQSKGIEVTDELAPSEIRAANESLAIMFSVLGSQIMDSSRNIGRMGSTAPFDIALTTNFMEQALAAENGLAMDKSEPLYTQMLVTYMQTKRSAEGNQSKPYQYNLKSKDSNGNDVQIDLISVPIVLEGEDKPEYLNVIVEDGKKRIYLHSTSEKGSTSQAKAFGVNDMSLEMSQNANFLLHMGLVSGKDIRNTITAINLEKSSEGLKILKNLFSEEFSKGETSKESHLDNIKVGEENFAVYQKPNRSDAEVKSFNNVANLSQVPADDGEPETAAQNVIEQQQAVAAPAPEQEVVPQPQPQDQQEQPSEIKEEEKHEEEKPTEAEQKPAEKKEVKEDKKEVNTKLANILFGLGFLCIVLSTLVPGMQLLAIALFTGCLGTHLQLGTKLANQIKKIAAERDKRDKKVRDKDKQFELTINKLKDDRQNVVNMKNANIEEYNALQNQIAQNNKLSNDLQQQLEAIDNQPWTDGKKQYEREKLQNQRQALNAENGNLIKQQQGLAKEIEKNMIDVEIIDNKLEYQYALHAQPKDLADKKKEYDQIFLENKKVSEAANKAQILNANNQKVLENAGNLFSSTKKQLMDFNNLEAKFRKEELNGNQEKLLNGPMKYEYEKYKSIDADKLTEDFINQKQAYETAKTAAENSAKSWEELQSKQAELQKNVNSRKAEIEVIEKPANDFSMKRNRLESEKSNTIAGGSRVQAITKEDGTLDPTFESVSLTDLFGTYNKTESAEATEELKFKKSFGKAGNSAETALSK